MTRVIPNLGAHNFPGRREFIVTLKNFADSTSLYYDIETTETCVTHIPNRAIECLDRRPSSRNTAYLMTYDEAVQIRNDPRVLTVELNPRDRGLVKSRTSFEQTSNHFSKYTASSSTDINYGLLRNSRKINIEGWGGSTSTVQSATIIHDTSGKNVDVVMMDEGSPYPNTFEFAQNPDGSGYSRIVDYNWFQHNPAVTGNPAGNYSYDNRDQQHPAHVSGITAGNTQGWARDANIYHLSFNDTHPFQYVKEFHKHKPINPLTGIKNPTINSNSWGYITGQNTIQLNQIKEIHYRGTTFYPINSGTSYWGTYTWEIATLAHVRLPEDGYEAYHGQQFIGGTWTVYEGEIRKSIGQRDAATDADAIDAMIEGVIIVASAGNDYGYADVPDGPDFNNYIVKQTAGNAAGYFSDIIYDGSKYIAVGEFYSLGNNNNYCPMIATSTDCVDWSYLPPISDVYGPLNAVACGNGITVAVGDALTVVSTTSFNTYNVYHYNGAYNANGLCWNGSQFLYVGTVYSGTSTNGISWDYSYLGNIDLYSVVWTTSTQQYCSVGTENSYAKIFTSTNGVDWTEQNTSTSISGLFHSIAYGNGLYVAVGRNPAQDKGLIYTSPDTVTWTQRAADQFSGYLNKIIWSGSEYMITGSLDTVYPHVIQTITSSDGINWMSTTSSVGLNMSSVMWNGSEWIGAGQQNGYQHIANNYLYANYPAVFTSTNGISWAITGTTGLGFLSYWDVQESATYYHRGSSPGSAASTTTPSLAVISVGATGHHDTPYYLALPYGNIQLMNVIGIEDYKAEFSGYGPRIDVWAPGSGIQSIWTTGFSYYDNIDANDPRSVYYGSTEDDPINNFKKLAGTSMSAPQVAGVLASLAEKYPRMTQAEARAYILNVSTPTLASDNTPIDILRGYLNNKDIGFSYSDNIKNNMLFYQGTRHPGQEIGGYYPTPFPPNNYSYRSTASTAVVYPRTRRLLQNPQNKTFVLTASNTSVAFASSIELMLNTTGLPDGTEIPYILSAETGLRPTITDQGTSGVYGVDYAVPGIYFNPGTNEGTRIITTSSSMGISYKIPSNIIGTSTFTLNTGTSTGGVIYVNTGTGAYWKLPLPFTISYLGTTYSDFVYAGSNSYITFGEGSVASHVSRANPSLPKIMISSMAYKSSIYYGTQGSSPNRTFTIGYTEDLTDVPPPHNGYASFNPNPGQSLSVTQSAFQEDYGDFTVEFWSYIKPNNNTVGIMIDCGYYVCRIWTIFSNLYFCDQLIGQVKYNQWQFIVVNRYQGTLTVYINGISVFTSSSSDLKNASQIYIGGYNTSETITGYMADLRITSGAARYSGDTMTVPTANFPTGSDDPLWNNVSLLMPMQIDLLDHSSHAYQIYSNGSSVKLGNAQLNWETTFYESTNTQIDIQVGNNPQVMEQFLPVPFLSSDISIPLTGVFKIKDNFSVITATIYTPNTLEMDVRLNMFPSKDILIQANPQKPGLYIQPGSYLWTCPAGVTSVSVVCVGGGGGQGGGGGDSYFINTSTVWAQGGQKLLTYYSVGAVPKAQFSGDGGGLGGVVSAVNWPSGGAGAGGYAGTGGDGNNWFSSPGGDGSGGGGGGASGGGSQIIGSQYIYYAAGGGGGVGIYGQGSSGLGGINAGDGGGGGSGGYSGTHGGLDYTVGGSGGLFGGGGGGNAYYSPGGNGGALGWKNNISVTPGEQYLVVVGAGASGYAGGHGGGGAVRIVWPGDTRQFPSTNVSTD